MKSSHALLLFISVVLIGGSAVHDFQHRKLHNQIEDKLVDIARHKVEQIQAWRNERLIDAQLLMGNRLLTEGLVKWLGGAPDPHILVELQSYLEPMRHPYGYFDYIVVDSVSQVRLNTLDPMVSRLDVQLRAALFEAWRTYQPVMTDFYQSHGNPYLYLGLVAPLFDDLHPAGAIILFIDPHRQLHSLLESWSSPGIKAETLLLRRDGSDVMFLDRAHSLLGQIQQAVNLVDASVAQAIKGKKGLIETKDLNQKPVAAIAMSVPETPWILLMKTDHKSLFAQGERDVLLSEIGLLAILVVIGLVIALAWQIHKRNDDRLLREAEMAERKSLEQFLNLFNQSLDAIFLLKLDFSLIDANPAAVQLLGYSRDDLVRLELPDILAENERPHIHKIAPRLLSGEIKHHEWLHKRKDGTIFPAEITAKALNSDKFFATVRDISLRKRMERMNQEINEELEKRVIERTTILNQRTLELFKSQERFRLAMDVSSEGLWEGNLKTGKFYYSPGFCKMLGFAPDDLPGNIETWIGLLLPAQRHEMLVKAKEMLRTGSIEMECQMVNKAGDVQWVLCRGAIVSWNDQGEPERAIGTHQDITERKKIFLALRDSEQRYRLLNNTLEEQVERRTAELKAATLARENFLAHMSHEIRTPMNAILGLTQLMENEPHTEDQGELLARINESGDLLLKIINDILDFSKIEAGQFTLEEKPFSLTGVFNRLSNVFSHTAIEKGLKLELPFINSSDDVLIGDALRLEQVLINLVSNAIKFTPQGAVTLNANPIEINECKIRYRLEIQDTGIGISQEQQESLFNPFIQADKTISRRFGGTGLGLAICRRLIELMGGQIGVISTVDKGSLFWLEIPFGRVCISNISVQTEKNDIRTIHTGNLNGLKVLAVDDKAINLTIVKRALMQEGANVTLAADGKQALDILQTNPNEFDIVLMDVEMPVMDGLQATREIRLNDSLSHIPVIIVSAGVLSEERSAALKAGADDFLAKPINLMELKSVLGRYTTPEKEYEAS